jgi:hypothetical protein
MPVIGFLCAAGRLRPLPRWWRRFARALERQAMSRGGTSPLNLLGRRAYNPQSRLLRAYCFVSLPGLSTHTNGSLDPAVTCKTLSCSCAASFCASSTVVRPALRLSHIIQPPIRGWMAIALGPVSSSTTLKRQSVSLICTTMSCVLLLNLPHGHRRPAQPPPTPL